MGRANSTFSSDIARARAESLHRGGSFRPRRRGHVFCSSRCRHRGERRGTPGPVDREQVARLFDKSRDSNQRVRDDDWHPTPETPDGLKWRKLDAYQTLGRRRRRYLNLIEHPSWDAVRKVSKRRFSFKAATSTAPAASTA